MSEGRRILVRIAEHALGRPGDVLVTLGLGSCVAIVLHDREAGLGGLAHALLPDPALARDRSNPAKFVSTAVPLLLQRMLDEGAHAARLSARLVGGASMFGSLSAPGARQMGERNVAAAREALAAVGLRIGAEDVGGERGRSLRFCVATGEVVVSSVSYPPVLL